MAEGGSTVADLEATLWPPVPIRTERLLLRPTQASDRDGFLELLWSHEVRQYLGGPAGSREDLERQAPPVPGARPGVFAIEREGAFIGMVHLTRRDADQPGHTRSGGGELEVGYMLLRSYWGHGYAQEALRGVLGWVTESLPDDEVLLITQTRNARSMRLARHVGFAEVGRFVQFGAEQWLGRRAIARSVPTGSTSPDDPT
jgi:RimJ/RimL family protein N-acetyltransferase